MVKLTKRLVDAAEPRTSEYFVWDEALPGFGLRVSPKGRKSYFVQYRLGSTQRRRSLGVHGPITPDEARNLARAVLGDLAKGVDPHLIKAPASNRMTVADLVGDYLLHGVALKKASTLATDRGRIERHILPLLGDRWVDELQPADVEKFVRDVTNGLTAKNVKTKHRGRAIVRGGGGTAARTVGLLGGIISYGVRLYGLRADNPVQGIKRRKDIKRVRFLSASEFSRLGKALEIAETDGTNPFGVAALRLLLGTGARRGEILSLEWSHVDLERGQLRLPDSKTGEKTIYLSRQMVSLLEQLPRVPGSRFVLPSARSGQHFVGLPKVWKHVCALARLSDLHIHDLRHAFATTAAAEGASLFVIGGLLGHKDPRTTQIYAHLADDTLARAAQLAADKMSSLSDYKTQGG